METAELEQIYLELTRGDKIKAIALTNRILDLNEGYQQIMYAKIMCKLYGQFLSESKEDESLHTLKAVLECQAYIDVPQISKIKIQLNLKSKPSDEEQRKAIKSYISDQIPNQLLELDDQPDTIIYSPRSFPDTISNETIDLYNSMTREQAFTALEHINSLEPNLRSKFELLIQLLEVKTSEDHI